MVRPTVPFPLTLGGISYLKQIYLPVAENIHSSVENSLSHSVPASLRNIPTKYNIIVCLWTYAFYKMLESIRRAAFASPLALEHFIYYAYRTKKRRRMGRSHGCGWWSGCGGWWYSGRERRRLKGGQGFEGPFFLALEELISSPVFVSGLSKIFELWSLSSNWLSTRAPLSSTPYPCPEPMHQRGQSVLRSQERICSSRLWTFSNASERSKDGLGKGYRNLWTQFAVRRLEQRVEDRFQ